MKRSILLLLSYLMVASSGYCSEYNKFCSEDTEYIRSMMYWGEVSFSIMDYENFGCEDSYFLKLIVKSENWYKPSKALSTYFNNEFARILKQEMPFYDTSKERFKISEVLKYKGEDGKIDFERVRKLETERIEKSFGKKPGILDLTIYVKRRTYPVLFIIESSISTLPGIDHTPLKEKYLGYSTPDKIESELKKSITIVMKRLHEDFVKEKNCSRFEDKLPE